MILLCYMNVECSRSVCMSNDWSRLEKSLLFILLSLSKGFNLSFIIFGTRYFGWLYLLESVRLPTGFQSTKNLLKDEAG